MATPYESSIDDVSSIAVQQRSGECIFLWNLFKLISVFKTAYLFLWDIHTFVPNCNPFSSDIVDVFVLFRLFHCIIRSTYVLANTCIFYFLPWLPPSVDFCLILSLDRQIHSTIACFKRFISRFTSFSILVCFYYYQ